ncbi:MAG: aquaporin [Planctomycetes bacterium]|nr:aquaporin [Planctomycetota bacterium]
MSKYLTEFVGAFFLIFVIALAGGAPLGALAIGSVLMTMVYMGGHISGGHYNPAVTLAVFLRGKCPLADLVWYVVCQVLGAIAAAFIAYQITGASSGIAPGQKVTILHALVIEALFAFALALVVLNTATAKGTANNSFYGLAIGMTVFAGAVSGGSISGGAFNPAVGCGLSIVHSIVGGGSLAHMWLYIVGPLAGGVLAALVFRAQHGANAG